MNQMGHDSDDLDHPVESNESDGPYDSDDLDDPDESNESDGP